MVGSVLFLAPVSDAVDEDSSFSSYEYRKAAQETFRSVTDRLRAGLVRIETVGGAQPRAPGAAIEEDEDEDQPAPRPPRGQNPFTESLGSGFVVSDGPTTGIVYSRDGYIVTSSFNFARDPALISVVLSDGRRVAADLVARDQVRKIALLKVDADDLTPPEWVDMEQIHVGQTAIAIGLGFGGDDPSVTVGVVSALSRMRGNAIQTDAKLSPANYGGPLCDIDGRVLGLAVPMAQRHGELAGLDMYDSGVGFAVPQHRVEAIVAELKKGHSFQRGWLGIQVDQRSTEGLLIRKVADPSPMRAAGVQPGDKILGAEGRALKHFGHLMQTLYMIPAGEEVYLHLDRKGREFGVKVALATTGELGPLPEAEEPFDPSDPLKELLDEEAPLIPEDDDR